MLLLPLALLAAAAATEPTPPALATLADTERAFAARAKEKGVRDAFLEFFADEALVFTPAPENARLRLQKRPSVPSSVLELTWEPRQGDVAGSGDLGWLTGPATLVDHRQTPPPSQPENYLSIWRRQPDGQWRVVLDIGAGTPGPVTFPEGFHRFDAGPRFTGASDKDAAEGLRKADRALNDALAAGAAAAAWKDVAATGVRLHRNEIQPVVGRDAVLAWLQAHPVSVQAAGLKSVASEAGDMGYSFGAYRQTSSGKTTEVGSYVRVWTRAPDGRWQVAVDVTRPDE